jgi:hypothetical protein
MAAEIVVTITLLVKAKSAEEAKELAQRRLGPTMNVWFTEDAEQHPKPNGSLLFYNVSVIEPVKSEPTAVDDNE